MSTKGVKQACEIPSSGKMLHVYMSAVHEG